MAIGRRLKNGGVHINALPVNNLTYKCLIAVPIRIETTNIFDYMYFYESWKRPYHPIKQKSIPFQFFNVSDEHLFATLIFN